MAKKGGNVVSVVYELVKPITDGLGLTLWDVRFEKEGANWYLRVFLDREGGINITDCEAVNRPLDKLLDEADPIDQPYILEVSSTGLGRELTREAHFAACKGLPVRVKTIRPIDGAREFSGVLGDYEGAAFTLTQNGETLRFQKSECAKITLDDLDNETF